jgi:hypothetical protein
MTMKKHIILMLVVLISVIACACVLAAPRSSGLLINPGDRIGAFQITTGQGDQVSFATQLHCPIDIRTGTESCDQPVGTRVNIGLGVCDNNPFKGSTLDEYWSDQTYEMMIEGRPVNLQAFGSIDFYRPALGTVRVWNVVIVTQSPGTISARSKGVIAGEPFDRVTVLRFAAP